MSDNLQRWATYREVMSQPTVWRNWAPVLEQQAASLSQWIAQRQHDEIWFCGAGTSAYIGETLARHLNAFPGMRCRAIASTDLVSCPYQYVREDVRPLVISFGRSGDSAESIGTLDVLDALAPQVDRLNITCNQQGALANRPPAGRGEQRTLVLPKETHDSGFAMSASYTTMLLSALACLDPEPPASPTEILNQLADSAENLLSFDVASRNLTSPCERVVFLGSGPLTGTARESALKMMELCAGQVVSNWDSTLGFRHGPKAFVNAGTRVFVFLSSQPHTYRYDRDLADEIRHQYGAASVVTLGPSSAKPDMVVADIGSDAWASVLYVLLAQRLGVMWSEALGLNVDDPFIDHGNLSRVVSNVRLYDVKGLSS